MKISNTTIDGCFELTPRIFNDERGYFFESFNQHNFEEHTGVKVDFVQDNQSFSRKGVLRGLHYQKGEYAQAKLVRVIQGEVLDVAIDIRKDSPTYGKVYSTILSSKNNNQLFIPRGCAHGFVVLSDTATFFYKCDNYYNPASESGILFNDETFKIDWGLPESELILSEKDLELPSFKELIKS
jgi:dTDP-4-dehydrorhamnose 3,5-epimerase